MAANTSGDGQCLSPYYGGRQSLALVGTFKYWRKKVESKAVWELWGCQGGSCWSSLSSSAWSRARAAIGTGFPHDLDTYLKVMSPSEGNLKVTNTYVDWTHTVLTLLLFLVPLRTQGRVLFSQLPFRPAKASPMGSSYVLLEGCLKAHIPGCLLHS